MAEAASIAQLLLEAARRDAAACGRLAEDDRIHDSVVGFHAQQAIEKSLKAVLSHRRVPFRRTHDLAELLDTLADNAITPPPHAERLDELNPYAVALRYGVAEASGLDRALALRWIEDVIAWGQAQLERPGPGSAGA